MTKTKHTPGPWVVMGKGKHQPPLIAGAEEDYEHGPDRPVVAYLSGENIEANARLIAAAPLLLGALQDCVLELRFLGKTGTDGLNQAIAAIAAALGDVTQEGG
jgi:hypothetical protein